jgi:predicted 2-oxoglutarate/Fe(II)-dependent dioxygenase YbiX/peroxiredoxin
MVGHFQPLVGDPAPWFRQRSGDNPGFVFDMAAGRFIVLCFFGSAGDPAGAARLDIIKTHRALFDDTRIAFFGVGTDPEDLVQGRARDDLPGIRFFQDFDRSVNALYGEPGRTWYVLDPTLRVIAHFPFQPDGGERARVLAVLKALPSVAQYCAGRQAPVLHLAHVFEPEFCARLIAYYDRLGGVESGHYSEVDGRTVEVRDHGVKRRRDRALADPELLRQAQARIRRRVIPEIAKVHQLAVSKLERPIIGCYDAHDGGHFQPHRDNTTHASAHRQFALSINLNDDFQGGELVFPEYGPLGFKMPAGGAIVFSCALLHAVSRVRAGRRLAFLPFLYDEARAKLKAERHRQYAQETPG